MIQYLRLLRSAYQYRDQIAWEDFASDRARREFPEAYALPFPYPKGTPGAILWQAVLADKLGCRVTYPTMVRILNSFVLAAA